MLDELKTIQDENTTYSGKIVLTPTAKRLVRKMTGIWDMNYSMTVGFMALVLEDMTYDEAKAMQNQTDKGRIVAWLVRQARRFKVERALLRTLLQSEGNMESEKT